jgi:hypothetical protein
MKGLKQITSVVKEVLEEKPDTRNSDDLLYINVCRRMSPMALRQPFEMVFLQRNTLGVPKYESVRRSRQKIQEHHPELCGTDEVEGQRVLNEERVREYARSVNV